MRSVMHLASVPLVAALWSAVLVPQAQEIWAADDASPRTGPEIYGGVYVFGSLAQNRNLNVGGEELPSTTVKNAAGGGFKAGVFPAFTGYVVGIQAESFGLGHEVKAPASMGASGVQSGHGTLLAWTTMVSLIMQYPGKLVKPYGGVGAGWSSSYLVDAHLTKGAVTQAGTLRDTSLAFQYFAGVRMLVTEKVFVFGEYKYFASRYQWSGNLEPSLDLRTHIVAIGVGLSF
ncbi:MAG TPA: outer membrane beta-barrel protein [Nitrospira sp.]|nr:outer membrane beta-barrel protein [Nitrospira sp.]